MRQVVMLSAFRDSSPTQLDRYFRQARAYRDALKEREWNLRLALVEGDSTSDDVWRNIERRAVKDGFDFTLTDASHGGPVFGSVVSKERFDALSMVGNKMLSLVESYDDIVVYVESDLIWRPEMLLLLGSQVVDDNLDIVSPFVMAGESFYDIWAFRGLDGAHFAPFKPYHGSLKKNGLTEVGSVGSCLVMRAGVARNCRIIDNECLAGFCRDARNKGYKIWVDPRARVNHP